MPGFSVLNGGQAGRLIDYIVFGGGSRRSRLMILPGGLGGSVGLRSFTGFGFQPECLIFYSAVVHLGFPDPAERARLVLGVATAPGEEWCINISGADNTEPAQRTMGFKSDSCIFRNNLNDPAITDFQAQLQSFDPDGFTLNVLNPPSFAGNSTDEIFVVLALAGGGNYKAGVSTVPAAGGSRVINPGFEADLLFMGVTRQTTEGGVVNMSFGMGAMDRDGRAKANWMGGNHGSPTHEETTAARSVEGACLTICEVDDLGTGSGGTFFKRAEAVPVGFSGNDIEMDWQTVDGNEYKFGWLACENAVTDTFTTITDNVVPGPFITTPVVPKAILGYNCTPTAAQRKTPADNGFVEGAAIAISAADEQAALAAHDLTPPANQHHELIASTGDHSRNAFGFQQSSSSLRTGVFGCILHLTNQLSSAQSIAHRHDIYELLVGRDLPKIVVHPNGDVEYVVPTQYALITINPSGDVRYEGEVLADQLEVVRVKPSGTIEAVSNS